MSETERKKQSEYEKRQAARRALKKKKYKRQMVFKIVAAAIVIIILGVTVKEVIRLVNSKKAKPVVKETVIPEKIVQTPPEYDVQLLSVNEYSRPGIPLEKINGIVVHYTANPGTTAQQNRDYFEGLSISGETSVSSHFIVGIEGELIQCIPCNEIAYASNERNADTVSIECCISDETGKFSDATYQTLIHLLAWLVGRYHLETDDVIRHYDVTGKNCPKYYVENESAWQSLKADVTNYIESYGTVEAETEE